MNVKIALVTGSYKGIGLAICNGLAKNGIKVVMTSRDEKKGKYASQTLMNEDIVLDYHILNVTNKDSIKKCVKYIENKYTKLDILINNAAILDGNDSVFESMDNKIIEDTIKTNFLAPILVTKAFIPLLEKSSDPRIINISSGLGQLKDASGGFPAYSMSKSALNGFTVKMACECPKIKTNCICPGWVRTDMGGKHAPKTPEEGADSATWLATMKDPPTGKFFRDRKEIPW